MICKQNVLDITLHLWGKCHVLQCDGIKIQKHTSCPKWLKCHVNESPVIKDQSGMQ